MLTNRSECRDRPQIGGAGIAHFDAEACILQFVLFIRQFQANALAWQQSRLGLSPTEWKGGTLAIVVIGKIAFEFPIHALVDEHGDFCGSSLLGK